MPLQISIRESAEVTLLDLQGRATISDGEIDLLRLKLEQLVAGGARKILMNLGELTHVDSAGFGLIIKVCTRLRSQGGDLKLIRPRGPALVAFNVLRLVDLIPTFDTEHDALVSFHSDRHSVDP